MACVLGLTEHRFLVLQRVVELVAQPGLMDSIRQLTIVCTTAPSHFSRDDDGSRAMLTDVVDIAFSPAYCGLLQTKRVDDCVGLSVVSPVHSVAAKPRPFIKLADVPTDASSYLVALQGDKPLVAADSQLFVGSAVNWLGPHGKLPREVPCILVDTLPAAITGIAISGPLDALRTFVAAGRIVYELFDTGRKVLVKSRGDILLLCCSDDTMWLLSDRANAGRWCEPVSLSNGRLIAARQSSAQGLLRLAFDGATNSLVATSATNIHVCPLSGVDWSTLLQPAADDAKFLDGPARVGNCRRPAALAAIDGQVAFLDVIASGQGAFRLLIHGAALASYLG